MLDRADPSSLAFSAGMVAPFDQVEEEATIVIAGHRDSHFAKLADLVVGDTIQLTNTAGPSFLLSY